MFSGSLLHRGDNPGLQVCSLSFSSAPAMPKGKIESITLSCEDICGILWNQLNTLADSSWLNEGVAGSTSCLSLTIAGKNTSQRRDPCWVKGLLTGWVWETDCTFWSHPVCAHPSLQKGTPHVFRREVNATTFPLERTQAFAFVRNLFEFWQPSKETVFINLPLLAACSDYCISVVVPELLGSEQPGALEAGVVVSSSRRCHTCAGSHALKQCLSPVFSSPAATMGCSEKLSLWVLFSLRFCCCTCKTRA